MRAARCFDMPLSFSASYCFSFLTLGRLFGIGSLPSIADTWSLVVIPARGDSMHAVGAAATT
jgi:hypothetical protein